MEKGQGQSLGNVLNLGLRVKKDRRKEKGRQKSRRTLNEQN
jgi:hypothetical protein